jgi:hypothetical protein
LIGLTRGGVIPSVFPGREARASQFDPFQIGLQMGYLIVAGQPINRITRVSSGGELTHPLQIDPLLGG